MGSWWQDRRIVVGAVIAILLLLAAWMWLMVSILIPGLLS